ncbi:MraZ protein [Antricoccus suffuscus]|uniref:Transcriptional regulator MraZ n=1 Tax=Antricoccus suffuscus TaxID=1629062 RepID=A0A2T0ZYH9_9ACTN|nr:division/cell wall cluster transcriptional repressor MraZ [Antricoccus suffuscus]PRZ41406.1 MraZ protein [Antricoccus suffuscus]
MFLGDFYPRMDEKGRIALPAKFRDRLGAGMVITKGQDRCLYVYPQTEFERMADRLSRTSSTAATRNYMRQFFGGADDQTPDKQGRVVVKQALREYAALDRECAVIGVNNRVEIWDAVAWCEFTEAQEQQFVEFSEDLLAPE